MKTPVYFLLLIFLTYHTHAHPPSPINYADLPGAVTLETSTGILSGTLLLPEFTYFSATDEATNDADEHHDHEDHEGHDHTATQELPFKIPIALIIAGSGPTDRDGNNPIMINNSLKMLAEGLAEQGIASLRYDKRGVAGSEAAAMEEVDMRLENYIDDAVAWVDWIKKDDRFSEVTIIGHSLGSLIGMVVAQDQGVKKFVSIAGTGSNAAATLRRQLQDQPPFVLEYAEPILEQLEQGQTVEKIDPLLNQLFRPSVQPYLISWFQYEPTEVLARLKKPILIIQGNHDIQVTVEDAQMLADANRKAQLKIFDGMNHILKTASAERMANFETYNDPELPLHDGLINMLTLFIRK